MIRQHETTASANGKLAWPAASCDDDAPGVRFGGAMTHAGQELIDTADIGLMGLIQTRGESRRLVLGTVESLTPRGVTLTVEDDIAAELERGDEVVLCIGFRGSVREKELGFVNIRRVTNPATSGTRIEMDFPHDDDDAPRGMLATFVQELLTV